MSARTIAARLLLLALLSLAACSETFDRTYKTRTEAEYDGAIAAGRVPAWFPPVAMQIREAHDIDTRAVMVTFTYPKEHTLEVPASCTPIAASSAPPPPFERAWWPKSVPERAGEKLVYHRCGELYVAVLLSEAQGYVWSRK